MATIDSQGKQAAQEGDMQPVPGCHRGVLAGLTVEEREAKLEAQSNAIMDEDDDLFGSPASMLYNASKPGAPIFKLTDIMGGMKKDDLLGIAYELQLQGVSGLKKAELAEAVLTGLCDASNLTTMAESIPLGCIDRV